MAWQEHSKPHIIFQQAIIRTLIDQITIEVYKLQNLLDRDDDGKSFFTKDEIRDAIKSIRNGFEPKIKLPEEMIERLIKMQSLKYKLAFVVEKVQRNGNGNIAMNLKMLAMSSAMKMVKEG